MWRNARLDQAPGIEPNTPKWGRRIAPFYPAAANETPKYRPGEGGTRIPLPLPISAHRIKVRDKPRLTWLGNLIAHYASKRIGEGGVPKPAPFVAPVPGPQPFALALAAPLAAPAPFATKPSISGNERGTSKTKGLNGTQQSLADGTIVIEATEALAATRTDGLDATLTAFQRRVEKDGVVTVEQKNYSYRQRQLPEALLLRQTGDFPADVPAGFTATAVRSVVASQFGKNDTQDEAPARR
jgi:hypothetical protein